MNKEIYNYLNNYFENRIELSTEKNKLSKHFYNLERFVKSGLLTQEQQDLIVSDMCNLMNYTIKVLSKCPGVEIHLMNTQKITTLYKLLKEKPINNISAIGFQYEEDSFDEDF